MEIWTAIREAPEWVALIVALGGLGWQQRQISDLSKNLDARHESEVDFLRQEVNRLRKGLDDVRIALMRKTDLNGIEQDETE